MSPNYAPSVVLDLRKFLEGIANMTKIEKSLSTTLGWCRSGTRIYVPYDLTPTTIESFVGGYSVSDKIDFLCAIEFQLQRFERSDFDGFGRDKVQDLFDILRKESLDQPMSTELADLKIITSIDRVKHGKRLCL